MNGVDLIREYHDLTSFGSRRGRHRRDPRLVSDYEPVRVPMPPQFKSYLPSLPRVAVPEHLHDVLFLSAGVTRSRTPSRFTHYFRAAGSAGNRAPLEVYVVTLGAVYHYEPLEHQLSRLGRALEGPDTLVVTGVPWRTAWKYTERGFRHLYWDSGTMLSQLLALAPHARLEMGFVDARVSQLLGLVDDEEYPLAVVVLGDGPPPLNPPDNSGDRPRGIIDDRRVSFPLIAAAQHAGDLLDDDEVEAWRTQPARPPEPTNLTFGRDLQTVIRARGSTRAFDAQASGPTELLDDALGAATALVNADFHSDDMPTLLEHHTLVHAIDGVVGNEGSRRLGARLCLGQALGGEGCYTAFHCSDLDHVLAALGPRGYRAAQLEAGIVEGRLHLCAFALAFGATGLTFLDDDVRSQFGPSAWPMLVTAVGMPTSPPAPSGTPGRPAPLRVSR